MYLTAKHRAPRLDDANSLCWSRRAVARPLQAHEAIHLYSKVRFKNNRCVFHFLIWTAYHDIRATTCSLSSAGLGFACLHAGYSLRMHSIISPCLISDGKLVDIRLSVLTMKVKYVSSGEHDFRDKTLLLPSEGIGNVGQLAVRHLCRGFALSSLKMCLHWFCHSDSRSVPQVDLIIHNARLDCIGSLRDPHNILPCVGSDPYGNKSVMSSELQIYSRPEVDLVVLQQRGCTALGRCICSHMLDILVCSNAILIIAASELCVPLMQAGQIRRKPLWLYQSSRIQEGEFTHRSSYCKRTAYINYPEAFLHLVI